MKIRYLTYNEILEIYREQMSKHGGFGAIRDNNTLLSIIANPQRQFAEIDLYPTLAEKTAIFIYSIMKGHPFVDGNKRTAFVCGRMMLRLNGHDVNSILDYYKLILKIANNGADKEDVFDWFKLSISPISGLKIKMEDKNEVT